VEKIEIGIDEIFSKRKEVCTCPKGGMYGDEVCSDCGGTEWVLSKELKEIGQEIKNLITKEDDQWKKSRVTPEIAEDIKKSWEKIRKMYVEGLGTPLIAFKTDNDISWVRKVVNGKGSKLLDSCGYEDLRDWFLGFYVVR